MKKLLLGTILLALIVVDPIPTMAGVDISIGISLPPPIVFAAPPEVIVIPGTYVYVVPDVQVDLFFWNGWWWRLWEGRWYRSHYYDRGWGYYSYVPSFYFDVDFGWRGYYRDHNWHGHRWDYQRIPYRHLQQNWNGWERNRHWEKRGTWGVQDYHPRPQRERQALRQQRQHEYQQRPEVQQHQQQRQQPQRQPQVQKLHVQKPQVQQPRQQHQGKVQQPQRQEQRPQTRQSQHAQPQGKSEGRQVEHKTRRGVENLHS